MQRKQPMNGKTLPLETEQTEAAVTRTRFDLEQEILECWKVTNDIQTWVDQGGQAKDFQVLVDYYERKFNRLWDTFEQLIRDRKLT